MELEYCHRENSVSSVGYTGNVANTTEAGLASAAFRCSVQSLYISLTRFMDLMFI